MPGRPRLLQLLAYLLAGACVLMAVVYLTGRLDDRLISPADFVASRGFSSAFILCILGVYALAFVKPSPPLLRYVLIWLAGAVLVWTVPDLVFPGLSENVPLLRPLPLFAIWTALQFAGYVQTLHDVPTDAAQNVPAAAAADAGGGAFPDDADRGLVIRRHRAVWVCLTLVLLASFLTAYLSFVNIEQRIAAINSDRELTRQSADVVLQDLKRVQRAFVLADSLNVDPSSYAGGARVWATDFSPVLRTPGEQAQQASSAAINTQTYLAQATSREPSDLPLSISLNGPKRAVDAAASAAQAVANDVDQLNARLGDVAGSSDEQLATTSTTAQLAYETLQLTTGTALNQAQTAENAIIGVEPPILTTYVWVTVLYLIFILFPWAPFLLFMFQKRESRVRQIYSDLVILDPSHNLLQRALGNRNIGSIETSAQTDGRRQRELVTRDDLKRLEDKAFGDFEYLLSLTLLSVINAIGWYYVFYPVGEIGITQLVANGADIQQITTYLLNLTPLTLGFVGSYFFVAILLVGRYFYSDLYPTAFLQSAQRFLLVFIISLVLGLLVPLATQVLPVGAQPAAARNAPAAATGTEAATPEASPAPTPAAAAAGAGAATAAVDAQSASSTPAGVQQTVSVVQALSSARANITVSITGLLAFFAGIFTLTILNQIGATLNQTLAAVRLPFRLPALRRAPLTDLDGINVWTEARLNEERIGDVHAMATAEIERLVLRTHFPTAQLLDWIDQAILYNHSGSQAEWFVPMRALGIRSATKLLSAATGVWRVPGARFPGTGDDSAFRQIIAGVTAAQKMGFASAVPKAASESLTEEILKTIYASMWPHPNLVYLVRYSQRMYSDIQAVFVTPRESGGGTESSNGTVAESTVAHD
jgi:hypothetical protein